MNQTKPRTFTEAVNLELARGLQVQEAIRAAKQKWPGLYDLHLRLGGLKDE